MLGWDAIVTRAPGYVIHVERGRLDLHRFNDLVAQARQAGDPQTCSSLLSALALWRGAPLADVTSESLQSVDAVRLSELRIEALSRRIAADLSLGRHAELVAELGELATLRPYDEGFAAQLMEALHGSGRRVDALAAYRYTRDRLSSEIGVEPSVALQALHHAILTAEGPEDADESDGSGPTGQAGRAREPETPPPSLDLTVPAQLPLDIVDLVGRAEEVAALRAGLTADASAVLCLAGQGGVGKTAVAVRAAYLDRDRFPDGQLYVDLRGVGENPLHPFEVLARFLRALGLLGSALPATLEERSAHFRSMVSDRRLLVLLDNAADEAQLRPLLPTGAGTATIITSRRVLAGLHNARHLELGLLDMDEAVELMATMIGRNRVEQEVERAHEIVRLCGRLPLAVRIASARLIARPYHRLEWLAARLTNEHRRLNELAVGDQAIRANIGLSYRGLHGRAQRAFRLLSLVRPRTFSAWLAAAVLGLDANEAQEALDTLVDHRMLEVDVLDGGERIRYRFHDLVWIFARERAVEEQEHLQMPAILSRVIVHATELARRHQAGLRITPLTVAPPGTTDGDSDPVEDPLPWLDRECPTLVALIRQAAEEGLYDLPLALAWTIWPFLYLKAHFDYWRATIDALQTSGAADDRSHAIVLSARGILHEAAGDHRAALLDQAEAALLFAKVGDSHGQARAEVYLALERGIDGDPAAHRELCEHAVVELQRSGDRGGEATALHHLAIAYHKRGDVQGTREAAARSAAVFADLGDQFGEARARSVLMQCEVEAGDLIGAAEQSARWLSLSRSVQDRRGEAYALQAQAELSLSRGDAEHAHAVLAPALRTAQEIGWQLGLPLMYYTMGEICRLRGEPDEGARFLREAVADWERNNYPLWQARALTRLGGCYRAAGRDAEAKAAWRQAHRILAVIDSPEADAVPCPLDAT